ncbi:PHP domain-containing protein [Alkaliphilus peptidifermentans]|uniref:Polymerase/histidinol phosphatase N-terminal domain-containing protein n=1 Tax=Alkaliphilus peptidifermentans DSM 18978 TaxID=1120976 RepID=A0A1G5D9F3_9FIRM|nr:PHP domain-containing protein [Alkaliphilus peptidifermentans]SCY11383.1 hypothetical protein SAMN03080606_00840 [Alkaliphilus peptidifermentans DSM 18978]
MKYIDMHVHTSASDGVLTPSEVIELAISKNLDGIAITDHDTVAGVQEGILYGEKKAFIVIPGIELSTEYNDEEVHILGYGIDYHSHELLQTLDTLKNARDLRAKKIVDKLKNLRFTISYEDVIEVSGNGVVGRPHIAKVLVSKGIVSDLSEAFRKFLNRGCPAYVPRYKITPNEAIILIKKVGGMPVIAHPGLVGNQLLLKGLVGNGAKGIEVYHPDHSQHEISKYLKFAEANNLIVTGGTDFHYPYKDRPNRNLGSIRVPLENVSKNLKIQNL